MRRVSSLKGILLQLAAARSRRLRRAARLNPWRRGTPIDPQTEPCVLASKIGTGGNAGAARAGRTSPGKGNKVATSPPFRSREAACLRSCPLATGDL